jgi:hypothetical protein
MQVTLDYGVFLKLQDQQTRIPSAYLSISSGLSFRLALVFQFGLPYPFNFSWLITLLFKFIQILFFSFE